MQLNLLEKMPIHTLDEGIDEVSAYHEHVHVFTTKNIM